PATTFLEGYDLARAYGPIGLRLAQPVIEAVGEARSNADVFGSLLRRLGVEAPGDPDGELEEMLDVLAQLPPEVRADLRERGAAMPPFDGRPVQFQDVWPQTPGGLVDLHPDVLEAQAPAGLYAYQPDPGTPEFPLALISPASER